MPSHTANTIIAGGTIGALVIAVSKARSTHTHTHTHEQAIYRVRQICSFLYNVCRDRKQQKLQSEQAVELKKVQADQTQHQAQQWATTRALRGRIQALEVVEVRVRAVEARLQTLEGVVHGLEGVVHSLEGVVYENEALASGSGLRRRNWRSAQE